MFVMWSQKTPLMLLLLCVLAELMISSAFKLTILHTNDFHARVKEINKGGGDCSDMKAKQGKCFGGAARLKTKVKEMRAKFPDSILVDAGDQFQGSLYFNVHKGKMTANFMNEVGYDAMALGNHEFDTGVAGLAEFLKDVNFNVLSSNIDVSNEPELKSVKKSYIAHVKGEKIGIVGYTTKTTASISQTEDVIFNEEIQSIQDEVNNLKALGIHKIIAVGHAGLEMDKLIAAKVAGLAAVVGGHTNTFLYNGPPPTNQAAKGNYPLVIKGPGGTNVLVVQAFAYGKYLGFIQIVFDDQNKVKSWNGNPILLDSTVKKDCHVEKIVKQYTPAVENLKKKVIGESYVDLDNAKTVCRNKECNLGNLITDAMVSQNLRPTGTYEWNKVSMAVVNSGGLRDRIRKGDVRASDISSTLPFKASTDIIELKGKFIKAAFEHSATKYLESPSDDLSGAFLQVSGILVKYDLSKPKGSRVVKLEAKCTKCSVPHFEPIVENRDYKMVIFSFLSNGGDEYTMFKNNRTSFTAIGDLDYEVAMKYVKKHSPIITGLSRRITVINDPMVEPTPQT